MSVSLSGPRRLPSSSLPPARSLPTATEERIISSLRDLQALYCPLRLPATLPKKVRKKGIDIPAAATPIPVDSGYASQDEEEDDDAALEEVTAGIRADPFERSFVTRWLTCLIGRVEEMAFDDDVKGKIVDDAAFILSSFSDSSTTEEEQALTRDFTFSLPARHGGEVKVTLNDAPLSTTDHTDVGLQSWGASIVLSSMMCADPSAFDLAPLGTGATTVLELGAGTGLVSLTLAKLLPAMAIDAHITATDYHPTVLQNCAVNIATNFPSHAADARDMPVATALLDWSSPPPHLRSSVHLLIASDVVYAPEHASWLRDCAAHLLTPEGVFWLMVTVRENGKFEGIPETVEHAFVADKCPRDVAGRRFGILGRQSVEKRRGIGRGDERGYVLYRIGWAGV
ncbi:hypothetical protein P153DRAFT_423907 [Dothidotthia symphoricarpi CBS 119687]|uniref:S-adenosyl-L-methionine-dependent methyltransferase n=1 Tax=Dothidotthia symphoricarpi CBS 119687 TaxID=1392245 RepID=A0A6A6AA07_9PLEO|nr:uncharacterized protein P153DRAFT_423907 [Dothidotthia symphoricarpi CBS 119687]KAF2127914.1 hypothetical protein P153DRAFT_423907 [Dothidotthia symphoricarpi CBS 119687]